MNDRANLLVESYLKWVRTEISAQVLQDGVTQLTTPFIDRHNDHIQIYAEPRGPDLFLLTDDGYIVAELKSSAVETRGSRREEIFHQLLAGHGVVLRDKELQAEASTENLGQRVHNLIQAMLSLDDMFVLAQPTVQKIFIQDVADFLDEKDVRYTPRVKLAGKSGLDHLVDFVIPKSREAPERVVQVLNSPRRDRVESMLFSISDTQSARGQEVSYFAIINDTRNKVPPEVLNAFSEYSVQAYPWSHREKLVQSLAA